MSEYCQIIDIRKITFSLTWKYRSLDSCYYRVNLKYICTEKLERKKKQKYLARKQIVITHTFQFSSSFIFGYRKDTAKFAIPDLLIFCTAMHKNIIKHFRMTYICLRYMFSVLSFV